MLILQHVSISLKHDQRTLIDDFGFALEAHQKVALIGEEGNGKSTLLKAIASDPDLDAYATVKGNIIIKDEIIGYLPQMIDQKMEVRSTLAYFEQCKDPLIFDYGHYYKCIVDLMFDETLIDENIHIGQLSGGERIKFLILCELIKMPTLLLLDEPSNDLDLATLIWITSLIKHSELPIMFVSHDEMLLQECANTIIHIEQIAKKQKPRITVVNMSYQEYVHDRKHRIQRQQQLAFKERETYQKQMERYRHVHDRVQHELRTATRQDPSTAKNLKDKMRSIKSMGKRFEREKADMTDFPDFEESIFVRFKENVFVPAKKVILDLSLNPLMISEKTLSQNVSLHIKGPQKICIIGKNGIGKTTLLKQILIHLASSNLKVAYMPQNYHEQFDANQHAIAFLSHHQTKEEITKIRSYLGAMRFTRKEMVQSISHLSGGQKAKLYFLKMLLNHPEVLVLDEPTRNISPLSAPQIREALTHYGGCIISVSHDRTFIDEVCDVVYELDKEGLHQVSGWEVIYGS